MEAGITEEVGFWDSMFVPQEFVARLHASLYGLILGIVDDMLAKARQILVERRLALENVTKRLIEVEVMDAEELGNLIDETLPGPRVKPGTQGVPRSDAAARTDTATDEANSTAGSDDTSRPQPDAAG